MSKEQPQDKSNELTYLVIHVKHDTQPLIPRENVEPNMQDEIEAKERVKPEYMPTKDRVIESWEIEYDLGPGAEYLAMHYLMIPTGEQWDEDYKGRINKKFKVNFDIVMSKSKLRKKLEHLTNDCPTDIRRWLAIVSHYTPTKKLDYTPDEGEHAATEGEPYYTVIPSVDSNSNKTMIKILMPPPKKDQKEGTK